MPVLIKISYHSIYQNRKRILKNSHMKQYPFQAMPRCRIVHGLQKKKRTEIKEKGKFNMATNVVQKLFPANYLEVNRCT